jgi:dipeptidyl aminopeptidase/acylaminoacyl peptidase
VRVPDEVALGPARVTIDLGGWPEGRVAPSTHVLPVVPRKPLPALTASPEQRRVWSADGYSVDEVRYTPDGRTLVVVTTRRVQGERTYQFRLWDAATGEERCKFLQIDPEPMSVTYSPHLAESPDGKLLAVRYNRLRYVKDGTSYRDEESGQLHVFDLQTGRPLWHHDGAGWSIAGAEFSPDGLTIAAGHHRAKRVGEGRDQRYEFAGEVRLWDVRTGRTTADLPGGPNQLVSPMGYSPDGRHVAIAYDDRGKDGGHSLALWDLASRKITVRHLGMNPVAAFSPAGRQVAIATSTSTSQDKVYRRAVKVWDLARSSGSCSGRCAGWVG